MAYYGTNILGIIDEMGQRLPLSEFIMSAAEKFPLSFALADYKADDIPLIYVNKSFTDLLPL